MLPRKPGRRDRRPRRCPPPDERAAYRPCGGGRAFPPCPHPAGWQPLHGLVFFLWECRYDFLPGHRITRQGRSHLTKIKPLTPGGKPLGVSGQNTHKKVGAEKFSTPTFGIQNQLLSFDSASGASALASTAVDAAASVDDSLVSHADRANGAGVNTSAASNALVGNHMSHCETPYLRADCILPPAPCTVGSPAAASKWVVFSPTCSEILYHPGTRFARPKR